MNAILKALDEIKFTIPTEMLYVAFTIDEPPELANSTSLDDKILNKCLRSRVLVDCNLVGGVELVVPLMNVAPALYNDYYTVYVIPAELLNNRTIISALNLTLLPYYTNFSQTPGAGLVNPGSNFNSVTSVATRMSNTFSDVSTITNAQIDLVANNTVAIYANYRLLTSYGLRCVVENDSNLQNISPRSYSNFSHLCVLGVKSYIYNKLIIKINMGYLHGGQELGQFKTILDNYEGVEEEYRTYLKEVWMATAHMNDTNRYHRFLKSMISPGL